MPRPATKVPRKLISKSIQTGDAYAPVHNWEETEMPVPKSKKKQQKGFEFSPEDKAIFAEIREFEGKVGHVWTFYAEQGESWTSYRRRGCPLQKAPPLVPKPVLEAVEGVKQAPTPFPPKEAKPPAPKAPKPRGIYGHAATAILRWMGAEKWTREEAMKALKSLGSDVVEATANIQMKAGAKGGDCGGRGPVPNLTPEQRAELEAKVGKAVMTGSKPKGKGKK